VAGVVAVVLLIKFNMVKGRVVAQRFSLPCGKFARESYQRQFRVRILHKEKVETFQSRIFKVLLFNYFFGPAAGVAAGFADIFHNLPTNGF